MHACMHTCIHFGRDVFDQKKDLSAMMVNLSLQLDKTSDNNDKIRLLLVYLVASNVVHVYLWEGSGFHAMCKKMSECKFVLHTNV